MLKPGVSMVQKGDGGVHQQGHAGTILNQTANSEKLVMEFIEGFKAQSVLTERSMSQTNRAMEYLDKTINEITEQRKLLDKVISKLVETK